MDKWAETLIEKDTLCSNKSTVFERNANEKNWFAHSKLHYLAVSSSSQLIMDDKKMKINGHWFFKSAYSEFKTVASGIPDGSDPYWKHHAHLKLTLSIS